MFKLVGGGPCQMMMLLTISTVFCHIDRSGTHFLPFMQGSQQTKTIHLTDTMYISQKYTTVRVVTGKEITVRQ